MTNEERAKDWSNSRCKVDYDEEGDRFVLMAEGYENAIHFPAGQHFLCRILTKVIERNYIQGGEDAVNTVRENIFRAVVPFRRDPL